MNGKHLPRERTMRHSQKTPKEAAHDAAAKNRKTYKPLQRIGTQ